MGPCTKALIDSGISEVHLATIDPNPKVCGKGVKELENNGIKTFAGEHEEEAKELIEAFAKHITTGLPFVTAKFAMSLDGKIATRTGDSKWITGDEARRYAHNLRFDVDAVMVGVNTVLADDPQLTARCSGGRGGTAKKQPLRVIVDGKGRLPLSARLFKEPGNTIVARGKPMTGKEKMAFTRTGAELLEIPANEVEVDLTKLVKTLGERGITSILVEGGGILLGSLFDAWLIDKVMAFISPVIIGGGDAMTPVAGNGVDKLADACRLKRVKIKRLGGDLMVSGYVKENKCSPAL